MNCNILEGEGEGEIPCINPIACMHTQDNSAMHGLERDNSSGSGIQAAKGVLKNSALSTEIQFKMN
jgi:hypothetical protein